MVFLSKREHRARQVKERNKAYYAANQGWLQKKSRERAQTRRVTMSEEELEESRKKHNEAAARYRQQNR
ncbi:hypothetical protein H0H92_004581 [Tricholoma furcatifolium]|nr:hypothetical protein H0H92_004581 [Tricholoma furcatifolium]